MIYTGYFAQLKKYQAAGLTPISIARKTPEWFIGDSLIELAPEEELLWKFKSGRVTEKYYREYYWEQLNHRTKWSKVMPALETLPYIILLCYEKSSDFCHRHILAEYLNQQGIACEEYKVETKGYNNVTEKEEEIGVRTIKDVVDTSMGFLYYGKKIQKSVVSTSHPTDDSTTLNVSITITD